MHRRLGGHTARFVEGVRGFHSKFVVGGCFPWGSTHSGSEVMRQGLQAIELAWAHEFGAKVTFPSAYAAEQDPPKQHFIMVHQPSVRHLFATCSAVLCSRAVNLRTGLTEAVPHAPGCAQGFTCVSRSSANPSASQNKACVQLAFGATGNSYKECTQVVWHQQHELGMLENLLKLNEVDTSIMSVSDRDWIINDFSEHGYAAIALELAADDFGSWPTRDRLYFPYLKGCHDANFRRLREMVSWLSAMKVGAGNADDHILGTDDMHSLYGTTFQEPGAPRKRACLDTAKFKAVHEEVFIAMNIEWPSCWDALRASDEFDLANVVVPGQREQELLYLALVAFPVQPQHYGQWMGINLNDNIARVLSYDPKREQGDQPCKDPWKGPQLGHIIGSSRWMLRRQLCEKSVVEVRWMTGVEAMSCIGFHHSEWDCFPLDAMKGIDNELLLNLAGNAFSGFHFVVVASALMACSGLPVDDVVGGGGGSLSDSSEDVVP